VGTSAGGARAKAVVAWHPETGEVRSGQIKDLPGYEPWLIKFDGVSENRDKEIADPLGYGKTEFAYSLMAKEAGIEMSECRLLRENGRSHFMTRRFDRTLTGKKLHMQSLCAMAHYDFNLAGATSYEQALQVMMALDLPAEQLEQQFRRAVFNVVARNQDDHTKNIAFLMNKAGAWRLSPAYDVTFSYNPEGAWTGQHQMSVNGKQDGFELNDLISLGRHAHLKTRRAKDVIAAVQSALTKWSEFAAAAGISEESASATSGYFRRFQ
jgi:serine/threonine-protein kinase HipA